MRTHNSNPSAKGTPRQPELHSIELFAGAGGLGIGFSRQGVSHEAVIEWDKNACETIKVNKLAGVQPLSHWPNVTECDVRTFRYESFQGIDLVTGGPPCQPFSMGGKHRGFLDERDMFPEAIRAVREASPRAFVFENVRGLMRSSFFNYFNYIKLQLEFPSIKARANEEWSLHLARLEKYKTSGALSEYKVIARLANACNFGVPQKRERVFFVGFRADVHRSWTFPTESHSEDALLYSKWITGEYWDRHELSGRKRPTMPDSIKSRVLKLSDANPLLLSEPWLTVRDALCDLPDPETSVRVGAYQAHTFQPGARIYPGHTGSPLDEPAKTLKAGDHGVPGGENMLRRPDGTVRYFTIRESARLQTFPDNFIFNGSWTETMRQLGNAVPVTLASKVAESVCTRLRSINNPTIHTNRQP